MKLISGFREISTRINNIDVTAAAPDSKLFTPDAIIEESDTFLVVRNQNNFNPVEENPVRILTKAFHASPIKTGTVIATGTDPLQLQAIIYDLDQDPICHPDSIRRAWQQIFMIAERESCPLVATPLLGMRDRSITFAMRCTLFYKTLMDLKTDWPLHFWLLCHGADRKGWSQYLKQIDD